MRRGLTEHCDLCYPVKANPRCEKAFGLAPEAYEESERADFSLCNAGGPFFRGACCEAVYEAFCSSFRYDQPPEVLEAARNKLLEFINTKVEDGASPAERLVDKDLMNTALQFTLDMIPLKNPPC